MVDPIITLYECDPYDSDGNWQPPDLDTNGIGQLRNAQTCTVEENLNGTFELTMIYPLTGLHYSDIKYGYLIACKANPYSNRQYFKIYYISKPLNGMVTIKAQHVSYDLSKHIIKPVQAESLSDLLTKMRLNNVGRNPGFTPFTITNSFESNIDFETTGVRSARSILGGDSPSITSVYDAELIFDNYNVNIVKTRGSDRGVTIRYGVNMTGLTEETNWDNVYSYVYPYYVSSDFGIIDLLDGEGYDSRLVPVPNSQASNTNGLEIYPLDVSSLWSNPYEYKDQYPSVDEIHALAETFIAENNLATPTVNLSVNFAVLSKTTEYSKYTDLDVVVLGDVVVAIHEKLGIKSSLRCIKTVYNVITDRYDNVELGSPASTLTSNLSAQTNLNSVVKSIINNQSLNITQIKNELNNSIVKEKTLMLNGGHFREFNYEYEVPLSKEEKDFVDSERIDVLSSEWLHAEKRLDVSPYHTNGCVYDIEFPAVLYTNAYHEPAYKHVIDESLYGRYNVELRASTRGVIPCTVSGTLNTEARIVGYVSSCTQYECLDTAWDYGYSVWHHNENHIHAVQKMAKFAMRDANGKIYSINDLENLKITFGNSKFKSGGYGGPNNALMKAVQASATFSNATTNAVGNIGEYLEKAYIYTTIPDECTSKASRATAVPNPGSISAFARNKGTGLPEFISLCDSTLAHVGNYSLSGTAEEVLEVVNDRGYWEIPANHFEYTYPNAIWHTYTPEGSETPAGDYVDIHLHVVQPEVYINIGKTLSDIKNKIYIDFGYIPKDDGWYSRRSSLTNPYWTNFTPKWSIAPYADGYEDIDSATHQGNFENDAVRGEYLSAIRKLRDPKTGHYPIYLVQTDYHYITYPFMLYNNDTKYQSEYDEAVAMMEGDVTVYTNSFGDTEESFVSGKWNTSENVVGGSNSIIGSYNDVDGQNNNDSSVGYTIVGSSNNIAGFAEHEKDEPDGDILIGSGNTLKDFKGLAFLNGNYGFVVDILNDDIWVYFGLTEKYSMRLVFKKLLNSIILITRNGVALPINDRVVDISVPEALSELTDDATHRLVTDTEKATWSAKQDTLVWDNIPTENSLNPVTSGGIYAYAGNYYTKTEIDNIIEMAISGMFIPVTVLPEPSADTMKGIYLVPSTSGRSEDNIRDEYITIALRKDGETIYQWELIGTTRVDLAGYVKKITIGDTVYTVDEGTANITLPDEPWATYTQEQDSIDEIFGTVYLVTENGIKLQTENDEDIILA